MFKKMISIVAVVGLVLALAPAAQAMDFVTVGDKGNAADTRYGTYGKVDYTYRIGKYEVSADQWFESGLAGGTEGSDLPVVDVSWHEAAQFCNWMTSGDKTDGYYTITEGVATIPAQGHYEYAQANGRTFFIPTEDEWYKAAYYTGSGYSNYPNGTDIAPLKGAGGWNYDNYQASPWNVGSGAEEQNNTCDMAGNVWEWNEALIPGSGRGIRGGAWYHTATRICAAERDHGPPSGAGTTIGFRVSEVVPEPATLALLALGGVWVLGRRRNVR